MNEQEFAELSAGHALHALSPDDESRFSEALAAHPEWQRHVDADEATAASLADAVAEASPPPALRAALLSQIAGDSRNDDPVTDAAAPVAAPAAVRTRPRAERGGRRSWFALAASIVLIVAIGVSGLIVAQQLGRPPAQATLAQIQEQPDAQAATADVTGGGTATAHWSETLGKVVLVTDGLAPLPSGRAFELWFVRDGTAEPAGVFTADAGDATAALKGQMHPGDTIAVTVEQAGGSPTGTPTTDPIVAIPTA